MDFKKIFGGLSGLKNNLYPAISIWLFYKTLYKVEPGFQSIKFDIFQGVMPKVYREGYHILIPFMQRAIIYDCRMKNHIFVSSCATKDLQILQVKTRIISRPDIEHLPDLYRLLGKNFEERVLYSIVYEITGAVMSQYNASQLINQRDTISFLIKQKLQDKSKEFYIELDDVALVI
jgi:regulator of protease activity HflC (stomatin/prohibitin superfamily)